MDLPHAAPQTREAAARALARMSRGQLIRFLHKLRCDFPLDFTDEYLRSLDTSSLRHIILAACLHAQNLPAGFRCA